MSSSDKIHVCIECDLTLAQVKMLLAQGNGRIVVRDVPSPSLPKAALPDKKKVNPATIPLKTIETILRDHFHVEVSKTNVMKYRLYYELATVGFKTLYSGTFVSEKELFTERFDIDHIVPKARNGSNELWNLVLSSRSDNSAKADKPLSEYAQTWSSAQRKRFRKTVTSLYNEGLLSKKKYRRLFVV